MPSDGFDPYHKWLGIPPDEQPPTHYRLLGLVEFESDRDAIVAAAERQTDRVRQQAGGPHALLARRLLNEIVAARQTLLNPQGKANYDASLKPAVVLPTFEVADPPVFRPKAAKSKAAKSNRSSLPVYPIVMAAIAIAIGVLFYFNQPRPAPPPQLLATAERLSESEGDRVEPESSPLAHASPADRSPPAGDSNRPASSDSAGVVAERPALDAARAATDVGGAQSEAMDNADNESTRVERVATDDNGSVTRAPAADMRPVADDARQPVPSENEQSKAVKRIRARRKAEFANAKTADGRAALAKVLLVEEDEAEDNPAESYARLTLAIDLAAAGGNFETVVAASSKLGERFRVDALADCWKTLEKSTQTKRVESLKAALQQFAEDATDQDRYELALGALKQLRRMSDGAEATQCEAELQKLDVIIARSDEAQTALRQLKAHPADARANQTAGEFLCFFKRDWAGGMLLLSRADEPTLKGLANGELAKPSDPRPQVRLADGWWEFAEKQADETIAAAAKSRARFWYMEALPELTGEAREQAEMRVTLEARAGQLPLEAKITPQLLEAKFHGRPSFDAAANRLTLVYDFKDAAQLQDFTGDASLAAERIEISPDQVISHVAQFKSLKMTGLVSMKSAVGEVIGATAGMAAKRDAATVKISWGKDTISSSENGPADDVLDLPFEVDANPELVLFRLGNQVVGRPMAKHEPRQVQLCGGQAGARFSQLVISGEPDRAWLAEFLGLPSSAEMGAPEAALADAKMKPATRFERISQIVLWNEHNSMHHNNGTRSANVVLSRLGKNVWQKKDLEVPWAPDQPTKLAIDVPQILADSVRVEITAWQGDGGGLSEVEVFSKESKNLASGAIVIASSEHRPGDPRNAATLVDGITDSAKENVGYWLAQIGQAAWAEVRLLPQAAPAAEPAPTKSSAAKETTKVAKKPARKSLDGKIYACSDDSFELCVNGVPALDGNGNDISSAGTALASGDVIAVKATNTAGKYGFAAVIKFSNGETIVTGDGWKSYLPSDPGQWAQPKQIQNAGPVMLGNSIWPPTERVKAASGVDAAQIWAPGEPEVCYLFFVVGRLDIPKKKAAEK